MHGRIPLAAEIVRRGHNAAPEVLLPDAVHHHPRQQRLSLGCHPQRQCFSPLRNEGPLSGLFDTAPAYGLYLTRVKYPGVDFQMMEDVLAGYPWLPRLAAATCEEKA